MFCFSFPLLAVHTPYTIFYVSALNSTIHVFVASRLQHPLLTHQAAKQKNILQKEDSTTQLGAVGSLMVKELLRESGFLPFAGIPEYVLLSVMKTCIDYCTKLHSF